MYTVWLHFCEVQEETKAEVVIDMEGDVLPSSLPPSWWLERGYDGWSLNNHFGPWDGCSVLMLKIAGKQEGRILGSWWFLKLDPWLPFSKLFLESYKSLTCLIYFFFFFLAALSVCCCARAFSSCGEWGPLFAAVHGPLIAVASFVAEHRL